jgi:preprotein translocase subunit SecG
MTSTLLIVQFILAVFITIAVLLQKSSGMGLGGYSGSNESMFGAKGPGGFLVKFTYIIGLLFVINTVTLGYLYNEQTQSSVVDSIPQGSVPTIPSTTTAPVVPSVPNK